MEILRVVPLQVHQYQVRSYLFLKSSISLDILSPGPLTGPGKEGGITVGIQ